MYELWSDQSKHRLYISIGQTNGADMGPFRKEVDRICRQLGRGFTCLIHFLQGDLLASDGEEDVFRLQEVLCRRGIKKAVYVRPEGSVIGRFQLEMLHINSECPGQDARSVEEAEALLNEE